MSEAWARLEEHLIKEGRSVQTTTYANPDFTVNAIKAWILYNAELLACIVLTENTTEGVFKAAQTKLAAILAKAGYTAVDLPSDALSSRYYQKPDDPRRPQKIIALSPAQIKQITAALQDKNFAAASLSYGYVGTVDGINVNGYRLACKGKISHVPLPLTKKGTVIIEEDVHRLFMQYGWVKIETEADSRSGMGGSIEYSRA